MPGHAEKNSGSFSFVVCNETWWVLLATKFYNNWMVKAQKWKYFRAGYGLSERLKVSKNKNISSRSATFKHPIFRHYSVIVMHQFRSELENVLKYLSFGPKKLFVYQYLHLLRCCMYLLTMFIFELLFFCSHSFNWY